MHCVVFSVYFLIICFCWDEDTMQMTLCLSCQMLLFINNRLIYWSIWFFFQCVDDIYIKEHTNTSVAVPVSTTVLKSPRIIQGFKIFINWTIRLNLHTSYKNQGNRTGCKVLIIWIHNDHIIYQCCSWCI